jgi:rRNA-processing protein FCF1
MPKKPKVLLMDANVLIDYQKSDFSVLGLVNKHVGEVHVLTTIIEEVDGLEIVDCERLGLRAIEPELNQLTRAAIRRGQLSFRDRLCLIVASDANFVCVTNDKPLRGACTAEGVSVLWGLEIMTALVRTNAMRAADAVQTAEKIHLSNPLHIPGKLVDRFAKIVNDIEKKRGGK